MAKRQRSISGDETAWALAEPGKARLGDKRLTERLVAIAAAIAEHPASSIPDACGTWAAAKGAYRFFDNDAVSPGEILAAHRMTTLDRLQGREVVLAVQDTTYCMFPTHPATKGLGPISRPDPEGFCVHTCLAISTEGVPLGLLGQEWWARSPEGNANKDRKGTKKTAGKESYRWQAMLESSTQGIPSGTRVVTVADREADMSELFLTAIRLQQDVIVRARFNRRLHQQQAYLWDAIEQAPVLGYLETEILRGNQAPRPAQLELRCAQVTLRSPAHRLSDRLPPVPITAVLARELRPPDGQEPATWLLLTTLPVTTAAEVETCVRWYKERWKIERYHYTLKSGCQVEELQLEDVQRLYRAIAVYSIVAWRLLSLTYANRATPQVSCVDFLTTAEWKALYCKVNHTAIAPDDPPDLHTATLWIARLGGFLARRHDGPPGVKVLWRGLRRLQDIAEMWELMRSGS